MGGERLDAAYYQDEFVAAYLRVTSTSLKSRPLAGVDGLVEAWIPKRTSLVFTNDREYGTPYLRAHDALERLPPFERYAALSQVKDGEELRLRPGWIVLTCSGRNFGPCAWVGRRLAKVAMTDIMRLVPRSEDDGLYALAFLSTPTGKALIRRDPAGSVINHLSPADLGSVPVPLLMPQAREVVITKMREAVELCDAASSALLDVDADLRQLLDIGDAASATWQAFDSPRASTQVATDLRSRLDAEFYSARHSDAVRRIASGDNDRLEDVADLRMLGRYKRYYTESGHGTPILSGGQMHQFRPVALRNISDRSFKDPRAFRLGRGWSLIGCDGRVEGDLGRAGYVSSLFEGWMASNHLMRVVPGAGIDNGYLHAALLLQETQIQLKSAATGSVIDALDPATVADVSVPRLNRRIEGDLGERVDQGYERWSRAYRLVDSAASLFEASIRESHDSRGSRSPEAGIS
ncbi:MAG: restriction endonuclease subunit [Solirubrobacterales bacterium]|nr:restriction endonuclease subunit [Solirubrobacterales bacterium]